MSASDICDILDIAGMDVIVARIIPKTKLDLLNILYRAIKRKEHVRRHVRRRIHLNFQQSNVIFLKTPADITGTIVERRRRGRSELRVLLAKFCHALQHAGVTSDVLPVVKNKWETADVLKFVVVSGAMSRSGAGAAREGRYSTHLIQKICPRFAVELVAFVFNKRDVVMFQ